MSRWRALWMLGLVAVLMAGCAFHKPKAEARIEPPPEEVAVEASPQPAIEQPAEQPLVEKPAVEEVQAAPTAPEEMPAAEQEAAAITPEEGPAPAEKEALAAVTAEEEGKYVEFMREGTEKYSGGDFKGAAKSFLKAVGVKRTGEAYYNLAKAYRAAGESPALVIYELEKAVEVAPEMTDALTLLGAVYFHERRFRDAEKAFGWALFRERSAANLSDLGMAKYMLENLEDATRLFEEAMELEPGRPDCLWYLARIHTALGETERAKRYWQAAVEAYGADSKWGRKGIEELDKLRAAAEAEK